MGYEAPSRAYLTNRLSFVSLDFIDDNHLLFTFRKAGLLKRLPECAADDQDQAIDARVVELPTGKVIASAEWRMHDRSRYLWPLGEGRFLLRQRNALFTTGASLELVPLFSFSNRLEALKLSPDRRLLIAQQETERHSTEEHRKLMEKAQDAGIGPPNEDVQLMVVDIASRAAVASTRMHRVSDLPVIGDGFIEVLPAKGNQWMIRYVPFQGQARQVASVTSSCTPTTTLLSATTALFATCAKEDSGNRLMQAFNLEGKLLWSQLWQSRYIWPTFSLAEDGSRFAFSSLELSHAVATMDPIGDAEIRAQVVGVFDTEDGKLHLVQTADPIASAGQNYALSAHGNRFVILRGGKLEVYDVPAAAGAPATPSPLATPATPAKQ